jgi:hypothetical protein
MVKRQPHAHPMRPYDRLRRAAATVGWAIALAATGYLALIVFLLIGGQPS